MAVAAASPEKAMPTTIFIGSSSAATTRMNFYLAHGEALPPG
jgi:hypothetical protein